MNRTFSYGLVLGFLIAMVASGSVNASPRHIRHYYAAAVHHSSIRRNIVRHVIKRTRVVERSVKRLHHPVMYASAKLHPKTEYPAGALRGHIANDLYAWLLAHQGVIGNTISMNCSSALSDMWGYKIKRYPRNRVAQDTSTELTSEYDNSDRGRTTVAQYEHAADGEARLMYNSLDWNMIGTTYRLDGRKLALLKHLSSTIDGRVLLAYPLAELMPGKYDGNFNVGVLDFALRNCGRRYIESIPSMNDRWDSFGLYQYTSKAVFDNGRKREGASQVNTALPVTLRIPGSVMKLRGNNHFRAAYLFAVFNLAQVVRKADSHELSTFERIWLSRKLEVAEFIATAHHLPANAWHSALRWLHNDARLPYARSLDNRLIAYAIKTETDTRALP